VQNAMSYPTVILMAMIMTISMLAALVAVPDE
jgi:hypothetical protein